MLRISKLDSLREWKVAVRVNCGGTNKLHIHNATNRRMYNMTFNSIPEGNLLTTTQSAKMLSKTKRRSTNRYTKGIEVKYFATSNINNNMVINILQIILLI